MRMKTFQALTMPDALRAIKEELGPDAVILSTREVRTGDGMFGLFGRTMIEVVAADDSKPAPVTSAPVLTTTAAPKPAELPREKTNGFQAALYTSLGELAQPASSAPAAAAVTGREWGRITAELRELRAVVERSVRDRRVEPPPTPRALNRLPDRYRTLYYELMNNDVEPATAETLVRRAAEGAVDMESDAAARGRLLRVIASGVAVSGPVLAENDVKKTVVFVGPTGVGKTTTIAKMAAHYKIKQKRSVALITLDTYRVAAVEQLRMYANIIGVSLEVALTKREALDFIKRRGQTELILLDTTGRSPMDTAGVDELQELLALDHPIETHLVMSATTRERDLMEAMSRYAALPINHLLFTKLDETTAYGNIYSMAQRTGLALSYFSIGQSVPEDLEQVTPARVADLVLGARLRSADWRPESASTPMTAAPRPAAVRASDAIRAGRELQSRRMVAPPPIAEKPTSSARPVTAAQAAPTRRVVSVRKPIAPARPAGFATRLSAWLGLSQGGKR